MASRAIVWLYFDPVSPWARFAYELLKRYEKDWRLEIKLKPVYLGGVMVASGNKPPITVVNKGNYMNRMDMPLTTRYLQIPYKFPDSFPVNTINIVRLLRVIEDKAPAKLRPITDLFFGQIWGVESTGATAAAQPANFRKIVPTSLISDEELKEWMKLSQTEENKERIKLDAAKLVEEGAFGFPWMVVQREDGEKYSFFGSDRFETMAFWLGGGRKWNGPFPASHSKL